MCKLTYPNDSPAGVRPNQNTEVLCSELHHINGEMPLNESQRVAEASSIADSIDALLAHGKKLLKKGMIVQGDFNCVHDSAMDVR